MAEGPNRSDPLFGSGAFIDLDEISSPSPDRQDQPTGGYGAVHVIDAKPISMVAPEDASAESTPKAGKRRSMEEMAKRPSWLPDDWKIDLRVRTSGASSGLIDRYFFDPSGRKFRSQNEVLHFLETGNKLKRNSADVPSGSSTGGNKPKKTSSVKRKKRDAFAPHSVDILNRVQTDTSQNI